MNIFQFAFEEGRDSKVSWENSESLRKANLLELQLNNVNSNRSHHGTVRKIAQLHPTTGRVVNVFKSLFTAARWVNEQRDKRGGVVDYQTCGNMKMQMLKGQRAYGYYWMFLEPDSDAEVTVHVAKRNERMPNHFVVLDNETGEYEHCKTEDLPRFFSQRYKTIVNLLHQNECMYDFGDYTLFTDNKWNRYTKTLPLVARNERGHFAGRYDSKAHAAATLGVTEGDIGKAINWNHTVKGQKFFYAAS